MEQIEKQEERRYGQLINNIGQLMKSARAKAAREVNSILVDTYWQIGRYIVEYEQGGKEKAVYGSQLLSNLSHDLKIRVGKGFSRSNLTYMRKFYVAFPNRETVSHKFTVCDSKNCEVFTVQSCGMGSFGTSDRDRIHREPSDTGDQC